MIGTAQKEELPYWDLFADILDNDTSPWQICQGNGNQPCDGSLSGYLLPHPPLKFRLRNGDSCLKEAF